MTKYSIILMLLLLSGCQASNPSTYSSELVQDSTTPANQIVFLDLEIKSDTVKKQATVSLLNKIVTDGKIKNLEHPDITIKRGDLKCTFLSGNNAVLHTMHIPNPLENILEYASESGVMQKKTLKLDKAVFMLRAPYTPATSHLLIEQVQEDDQLKEIATIRL